MPRMFLSLLAAMVLVTDGRAQQPAPAGADLRQALTAYVDSLARLDRFSGVVLLARGGRPLFQRAWGMADREAGRPNTVDTRFNLGSINKAFTATAIRQLVEERKVALDHRLIDVLPDYPNPEVARRVTVGQLLNHTSGIGGNIFAAPPGRSRHALRTNGDFIPLFASEPLQFEPGSREAYSNAGYIVLGAVIERLSGMSYYDYVREHIFRPAGMAESGSYAVDSLPANTALGYTRGGPGSAHSGPLRPDRDELPGRGSAAGGGYSTAADLLRFVQAAKSGQIPGAPRGGFAVAGGTGGVNAVVEADPGDGYDLIVLANQDPPVAEQIALRFRQWIGQKEGDGPEVIRTRPPR